MTELYQCDVAVSRCSQASTAPGAWTMAVAGSNDAPDAIAMADHAERSTLAPRDPMTDRRTIVFFPEGAHGPTNNCVGIGDVLRRRGHRVVFIVEESFAGTLEAKGFEERLMRLQPPAEGEEDPGQFWKDYIRETSPVFRKPTIEQLAEFIAPTFQA